MNNEQLFALTSPPSAEFVTAHELLRICNNHAKQNGYAVTTKNSKIEKKSQSNVILEESTKKVENINSQKNEDKHHPGSTVVNLFQKPVLEEPAMEGTCDADPVSLNNSSVEKEEL